MVGSTESVPRAGFFTGVGPRWCWSETGMNATDVIEPRLRQARRSATRCVGARDDIDVTEVRLWLLVAFALVADVHLTYVGIRHGHVEANPTMRLAIGVAGIGALVGAKLIAVGVGATIRIRRPRYRRAVPLALAIPWAAAAAVNATILA